MTKRKTAEQAQELTQASDASATSGDGQPAAEIAPSSPAGREPGDEQEKSWVKRASIIVDPEAGVKFYFDYEHHKGIITFNDKPSPELLALARPILDSGDYEWDKVKKDGWKKPIRFLNREDDRREAKKTFYQVANAIREHKGLPVRSFGEMVPI